MKNLPERIYLNIGDEVPADVDFRELSEVTWSEEKMSDNDIAFTRKLQWISVEDELPSNDDKVFVIIHGAYVCGWYDHKYDLWEIFGMGSYNRKDASYWMPIPPIHDTNTEKK